MVYTGSNFGEVYQGLKNFFNKIQNGVETQIFDDTSKLPLLGDELKKLKDNSNIQYFENLEKKFEQLEKEVSSGESSVSAIKEKLEKTLGKPIEITENTDEVTFSVDLTESKKIKAELAKGLGLSELNLKTSGSAETDFSYDLNLKFGLNKTDGFYVDTAGQNELKLDLSIAPKIEGNTDIGVLKFDAKTSANSKLNNSFAIDLQDADTKLTLSELNSLKFDPKLSNSGEITLNLTGKPGKEFLPTVDTDLKLRYNQGQAPFEFTDVKVKLGDSIGKAFSKVTDVTKPISNLIEPLTKPLPVLNLSLVDLAVAVSKLRGTSEAESAENAKKILDFADLTTTIGNQLNNGELTLPSFNSQNGSTTPSNSLLNPEQIQKLEESGLNIPILTDTRNVVNDLLLDKNVDFFTYTTPKFDFGLKLDGVIRPIPVFGPVVVKFGGGANASTQLKLGLDKEGVYLSEVGGSVATLGGVITAGAGVSAAIADVTIGGGIALGVNFPLNSTAAEVDDKDVKKIRGSALNDPLCLFKPTGELSAIVFGAVTVGTGFFSYTKRLDLANIKIIDFSLGCGTPTPYTPQQPNPKPSPELTKLLAGQGIIDLTGSNRSERIIVDSSDLNLTNTQNEKVVVTGIDPNPAESKEYTGVKLISINSGKGDDRIELKTTQNSGVVAIAQLEGGEGKDVLIGGFGDDFLTGGQGDDTLDGGSSRPNGGSAPRNTAVYADAPNKVDVDLTTGRAKDDGYGTKDTLKNIQNIEGSQFADELKGNNSKNLLEGGKGNDRLLGRGGDDLLSGGLGSDELDGGDGKDSVTYLESNAAVSVNLLTTRASGGFANGDTLKSIEFVQGSIYNDVLIGNNADNVLDGLLGDDRITGGKGADTLDGGQEGIDWVLYTTSSAGVNVNLSTGIGSGGDAQGDNLKFTKVKDVNGNLQETDSSTNSFNNLEGSNFNDTLEGDGQDNKIKGLSGKDFLKGGDGNDTLIGGAGADQLDGGNGIDLADYNDSSAAVTVDLSTGGSGGDAQDDKLTSIENLRGSRFGDTLAGNNNNNVLDPGLSSGVIDQVSGGTGDDTLKLDYSLNDTGSGMVGGYEVGYFSRDTATGTLQDRVEFNKNDVESFSVVGTSKADNLSGGSRDDQFFGGAGDDTIDGGLGRDYIEGDDGDDVLTGTSVYNDSDYFNSDAIDTLVGGAGADTFVLGQNDQVFYSYSSFDSHAVIKDFNIAQKDVLQLSQAGSYSGQTSTSGNFQIFNGAELIAELQAVKDFDLNASYVKYV